MRKVSERDCQEWLVRFQKQYAPSVVNNAIGTLRGVFAEAVNNGARFGNPAANLLECEFERSNWSCRRVKSS